MATSTKTQEVEQPEELAATPTEIAQPPFVPVSTIEDEKAGVRRLVPSPEYGWVPAPVDPSEADLAKAELRLAREDAEAAGEPYELEDGTVVQTTPEGQAEANAQAAQDQAKADAVANRTTATEAAKS